MCLALFEVLSILTLNLHTRLVPIIPNLEMRKLRQTKGIQLMQDYTVIKRQRQHLSPHNLAPETDLLRTL